MLEDRGPASKLSTELFNDIYTKTTATLVLYLLAYLPFHRSLKK